MVPTRAHRWAHPLLLLALASLPCPAQEPAPVDTPSFQADTLQGTNAPSLAVGPTAPPGWSFLPGTTSAGRMSPADLRRLYPARPPDEINPVLFLANGAGITQTTEAVLSPDTTYTLTIAVGTRQTGKFAGFDFKLDTVSGTLVGEWIGNNPNFTPPGTLADISRSFTTGPSPPGRDEKVRITLSQPANAPPDAYTDVSNVRLTADPGAHPITPDQPIDVLLIVGQANAQGWMSDPAQLSPANRHYADNPNPQALLAYRERTLPDQPDNTGTLAALSTQGPGFGGNFSGFGPELALGTDLADASQAPLVILKYTANNATLHTDFDKSSYRLYTALISYVQACRQQLSDHGYVPRLQGVFWLPDEPDTRDHPELFAQNLAELIHGLRDDLGAAHLPFFLTQIDPHLPGLAARASNVATLNQAMQDLAQKEPQVQLIPTADLSANFADPLHYSANQEILLGQRYAQAYQHLPPR